MLWAGAVDMSETREYSGVLLMNVCSLSRPHPEALMAACERNKVRRAANAVGDAARVASAVVASQRTMAEMTLCDY